MKKVYKFLYDYSGTFFFLIYGIALIAFSFFGSTGSLQISLACLFGVGVVGQAYSERNFNRLRNRLSETSPDKECAKIKIEYDVWKIDERDLPPEAVDTLNALSEKEDIDGDKVFKMLNAVEKIRGSKDVDKTE